MVKTAKHHVINGSVALVVAVIVSVASFLVLEGRVASFAASSPRTACFIPSTGHVYLRTTCKKGETKVVINSTGARGPQGLPGPQGQSAFDVAAEYGFAGSVSQWLASLVGPQGAVGAQGPRGYSGSDGSTGSTGAQGPTGPAGAAGFIPDYGYFIDVTSQTMTAVNTPTAMKFGTNVISNKGVTIVNGNEIHFAKPGTYNLAFSAQIFKDASASAEDADIWLSKNGQDVPNSNTQLTIPNDLARTGKAVAAWNFFVTTTTANEYCQLMWSATNTVVSIPYLAPQTLPDRPAVPSLILSVNQVG